MAYRWYTYQLNTEEGMRKCLDHLNYLFQEKIDMIWDYICRAPIVKNTRPNITEETLTERTLNNNKNHLVIDCADEDDAWGFHKFTLSLSNPNYVPVAAPVFFTKKDSKPCVAYIIYEGGEFIPRHKLKKLVAGNAKKPPSSWFDSLVSEFNKTFT